MLTIDKRRGLLDENKLSSRIRLIDLAIATQCTPTYFETDEASLVGTPLYASLNVHSGKKAGFRDDLESLGYVIAELLIQLTSGDSSKQLPWNNGKSDDEIWSIKKTLVENKNSTFYRQYCISSCSLNDLSSSSSFRIQVQVSRLHIFLHLTSSSLAKSPK